MKNGSLGVWFATNGLNRQELIELATGIERLGYSHLWYPESLAYEAFSLGGFLLAQTSKLVLATGIANIYARDPMSAAMGHDGLNALSDGRFLLGLGVSHVPLVSGRRGHEYGKPVSTMRNYVEAMAAAELEPRLRMAERNVVLAALGPKMLALSAETTRGALPYNVTPEHTAMAREVLGPDAWLCVEQKICLTTSEADARATAAKQLSRYMPLPNYRNNWLRQGFSEEELSGQGSPRFLDAMVAWGDEATIRKRLDEHYAAGANHVCIQPFDPAGGHAAHWPTLEAFGPGG